MGGMKFSSSSSIIDIIRATSSRSCHGWMNTCSGRRANESEAVLPNPDVPIYVYRTAQERRLFVLSLVLLLGFFLINAYFTWLALDPEWDPRIRYGRGKLVGEILHALPPTIRSLLISVPMPIVAYWVFRSYGLGIAAGFRNWNTPKITFDWRGIRGWNSSGDYDISWQDLTSVKVKRPVMVFKNTERFRISLHYQDRKVGWFRTYDRINLSPALLQFDHRSVMHLIRMMRRDLADKIPLPNNREFNAQVDFSKSD
jgi:hypothetical protein